MRRGGKGGVYMSNTLKCLLPLFEGKVESELIQFYSLLLL